MTLDHDFLVNYQRAAHPDSAERAMANEIFRLREENRRLVEAGRALLDFWADHETGPMSGVDADELTELECGLRAAIEGSK